MKQIIAIFIIVLMGISIYSQETDSIIFDGSIYADSIAYKAFRVSKYIGNQRHDYNSETLFYFSNGKVFTSNDDQTSTLQLRGERDSLELKTKMPNILYKCYDDGGYKCSLTLVYQRKTDTYGIVIDYNNVMFFYQCKATHERPWDNEPMDRKFAYDDKEWEKIKTKPNPMYTKDEVDTSLQKMKAGILGAIR